MHDPMTLAFSIKLPFGSKPRLMDIWHVDPERDGTDDSCGWAWPKLNPEQKRRLKDLAWWEGRDKHYLRYQGRTQTGFVADRAALYRSMIFMVARVLSLKLKPDELDAMVCEKVAMGQFEGLDTMFCWEPGYHTNRKEDRDEDRADHFAGYYYAIAKELLRKRRKWYQHPRWHLHHWRLRLIPIQNLKRMLFTRCGTCGKGFSYGESPTTTQWDSPGPKWFRSESNMHHGSCMHGTAKGSAENA